MKDSNELFHFGILKQICCQSFDWEMLVEGLLGDLVESRRINKFFHVTFITVTEKKLHKCI